MNPQSPTLLSSSEEALGVEVPAPWVWAVCGYLTQHFRITVQAQSAAVTPVASDPRLAGDAVDCWQLAVNTTQGSFHFFVHRHFGRGAWIMVENLRRREWEVKGILFLPDVILVGHESVSITPAVIHQSQLAQHWWEKIANIDPAVKKILAKRLALAITRFDKTAAGSVTLSNEWIDFKNVRHSMTNPVPNDILATIEPVWSCWGPWVEGLVTSLAPRDFYRNLLVGAPLFTQSEPWPLTLIDFGESYKLSSSAERLAQCLLMSIFESNLCDSDRMIWLKLLCEECEAHNVDMHGIAFFLALWGIRWTLWERTDKSDIQIFVELLQSAKPLSTSSEVVATCLALAQKLRPPE